MRKNHIASLCAGLFLHWQAVVENQHHPAADEAEQSLRSEARRALPVSKSSKTDLKEADAGKRKDAEKRRIALNG